jgi:hypothetical protein
MTKAHNKMMKNLEKEIAKIQGKTLKGLTQAALLIKGDAIELAPKDTGLLRNAMYLAYEKDGSFKYTGQNSVDGEKAKVGPGSDVESAVMQGGDKISVAIGNSASYAIWVHEIDKNYVVGQWKYLTTAIQRNQNNILKIIKGHAKK